MKQIRNTDNKIIDYEKEYKKQQVVLESLKAENIFLKNNLLKYERFSAVSDNIFFKFLQFFVKVCAKFNWFVYRVLRKIKNTILKIIKRGGKHD